MTENKTESSSITTDSALSIINFILKNYNELMSRLGNAKDVLIGRKPLSLEVEKLQNISKMMDAYNELGRKLALNPTLARVPLIDSFLKNDHPKMQAFFKENTIIKDYDGEYKIVSPEYASRLLERVKEEKTKDLKEKINIIPVEDIKNYDEFKHEAKVVPKNVIGVIDRLNPRYKSMVGLSAYVDELYSKKRIREAEKVRYSISQKYDVHGLKFCNLYVRGYLKALLRNLAQGSIGNDVNANEEIRKFIDNEAKAIFFIHPHMDRDNVENVIRQINDYLSKDNGYVAIHSLGASTEIAMFMVKRINAPSKPEYTIKTIHTEHTENKEKPPEFSKVWYDEKGKKTFSLIEA